MFVARVVMPVARRESWTVLRADGVPVEPLERYLAVLTDVERSPNTVKAYAHDLKDWFVFLAGPGAGLAGGTAGGRRGLRGLAATTAAGTPAGCWSRRAGLPTARCGCEGAGPARGLASAAAA